MRVRAKIALVAAGYVTAIGLAAVAVALYVAAMAGPNRQASSGMFAFGDSLLSLAVLGAAAVPPTAAGLVFLRPHHAFWRALTVTALVIAARGVAALAVCLMARTAAAAVCEVVVLAAWLIGIPR
jgi:hypothetical protein